MHPSSECAAHWTGLHERPEHRRMAATDRNPQLIRIVADRSVSISSSTGYGRDSRALPPGGVPSLILVSSAPSKNPLAECLENSESTSRAIRLTLVVENLTIWQLIFTNKTRRWQQQIIWNVFYVAKYLLLFRKHRRIFRHENT